MAGLGLVRTGCICHAFLCGLNGRLAKGKSIREKFELNAPVEHCIREIS